MTARFVFPADIELKDGFNGLFVVGAEFRDQLELAQQLAIDDPVFLSGQDALGTDSLDVIVGII